MSSSASTNASATSNAELIANRLSMASLIVAGAFFIYEGYVLINMHQDNPEKVSRKVAVAGWLTVFLGFVSLILAGFHLVWPTH